MATEIGAAANMSSGIDSYQVSLKCRLRSLWEPMMVLIGASIPITIVLMSVDHYHRKVLALLTTSIILCLMMIPNIIMYIRYSIVSKGVTVVVDKGRQVVIAESKGKRRIYSFDEIRSISRTWATRIWKKHNFTPRWGDLYFFSIEMQDGAEVIVTSLMTDKPSLDIGPKQVEIETKYVAWIPFSGRNIVNLELRR